MLNKVHHVTYVVESVSDMAAYMEKSFGLKQWPLSHPMEWTPNQGIALSGHLIMEVYSIG